MKKSTFLNIKEKGRQPVVPSSPNHLLVILLKPKKNIWWDLSFATKWGGEVVIIGCGISKSFV